MSKKELIEKKDIIKNKIRVIPFKINDKLIQAQDLTLCLSDKDCFKAIIDLFAEQLKDIDFDYLLGVDARGFIFAGALADRLNKSFIYIRKKGKLPGNTTSVKYTTEYSDDELEVDIDSVKPHTKAVLVDDVLATGGTSLAVTTLLDSLDCSIVKYLYVINLLFLEKVFDIPSQKVFYIFSVE